MCREEDRPSRAYSLLDKLQALRTSSVVSEIMSSLPYLSFLVSRKSLPAKRSTSKSPRVMSWLDPYRVVVSEVATQSRSYTDSNVKGFDQLHAV